MAPVVRLGEQGRLVIPAALRSELGLEAGDALALKVDGGRLVIEPRDGVLARLKSQFAHVPPGVSLVDELIADRREEARREDSE